MESIVRGVSLDSSVLIAAERISLRPVDLLRTIRDNVGAIPIVISSLVLAELGHGIYRAQTSERRHQRRIFIDDLVKQIPVHPIAASTAEIIARVGGEQAARGINLPIVDLIIASSALELGYAIVTRNSRDLDRIPGLTVIKI